MLTQERLKELLSYDPESGIFIRKTRSANCVNVGDVAGSVSTKGYIIISIENRYYKAHRLAWLYINGSMPINSIDHINCNKTDNRILNLRHATNAENIRNQGLRSTNKSGFIGVSFSKHAKKWQAQIKVNNKNRKLGYFSTPEEASEAYQCAAKQHHEEFHFIPNYELMQAARNQQG